MKLTVHTFLTLDGVMQGPGGVDEDRSGGFTAGGWQVPYTDDEFGEIVMSWFEHSSAALMGRLTYETLRDFWPNVDDDDPMARAINRGRKYVVAHDGYEPGWENASVISSADPMPAIEQLKREGDGELQVTGSAQLASALHAAGLVDEYRLFVFPVTVGRGKRLFGEAAPPRGFRIRETRVTGTGAIYIAAVPEPFRAGEYVVEDGRDVAHVD